MKRLVVAASIVIGLVGCSRARDGDRVGRASLTSATTRTDDAIASDVRRAIAIDATLSRSAKEVRVAATGGEVTLDGVVDGDTDRERLRTIAEGTPGVVRVVARVVAETELATDAESDDDTIDDAAVIDAIRRALRDDPTLADLADRVHVDARRGLVTLRGAVTSERDRDAIERRASEVPGVAGIDDRMAIDGVR